MKYFTWIVILLILPVLARASECTKFNDDPCAHSLDWEKQKDFESLVMESKKYKSLSAEEKNKYSSGLRKAIEEKKLSPGLVEALGSLPLDSATACLTDATLHFIMYNPEEDTGQACDKNTRDRLSKYFFTPSKDLGSNLVWLKPMAKELRPLLTAELDKYYGEIVEQLKNRLLSLLQTNKANAKLLGLVKAIHYHPETCLEDNGSNSINFVMGSKEIYACEGFTLRKSSLYKTIWTLAHEISHSMDPCDLSRAGVMKFDTQTTSRAVMLSEHPLKNLIDQSVTEVSDAIEDPADKKVCYNRNQSEALADMIAAKISPPVLQAEISKRAPQLSSKMQKIGLASIGTKYCQKNAEFEAMPSHLRHPLGNRRLKFFMSQPIWKDIVSCNSIAGGSGADGHVPFDSTPAN